MTFTLYNDDCMNVLPKLDSESIDLVFADPPFNVGKPYGGSSSNDYRADYREWCAAWISQCFRLLKPTGSMYLMTLDRYLEWQLPILAQYGVFINLVKWRNVSAARHPRSYWASTQPIVVYGKSKNYHFSTYAETRAIPIENQRWGGYTTRPRGQLLDYWDDIPFVYAGSIAHPEAILLPGSGTNKKAHPAQMPTGLSTRAITFSCPPNGVVLDPFMGSGTTGVSALRLGRQFIGIEIDPGYFSMAEKRIRQENSQMRFI